jgi:hypothetical protein
VGILENLKPHIIKDKIATKNRMHLEDAIMDNWQTEKDLKCFIELLVDHPDIRLDEQEVWNYIDSIRKVHELRMHVLMDTFCQALHLDGYGTAEDIAEYQRGLEDARAEAEERHAQKKGKKKK